LGAFPHIDCGITSIYFYGVDYRILGDGA
jgi:hypothetical protein